MPTNHPYRGRGQSLISDFAIEPPLAPETFPTSPHSSRQAPTVALRKPSSERHLCDWLPNRQIVMHTGRAFPRACGPCTINTNTSTLLPSLTWLGHRLRRSNREMHDAPRICPSLVTHPGCLASGLSPIIENLGEQRPGHWRADNESPPAPVPGMWRRIRSGGIKVTPAACFFIAGTRTLLHHRPRPVEDDVS